MKRIIFFLVITVVFSAQLKAQTAGELNPDFGTNGILEFAPSDSYDEPHALLVQPDDMLLTIGRARIDNKYHIYISRHNAQGILDNSFGTNGIQTLFPFAGYDNNVFDAKLLDDGKIVICGYLFGGADNWMPFLAKVNSNGSYDTSFGNNGYISHTYEAVTITEAMAIQDDGKIITVGYISNPSDKAIIMRYTENGQIDNTFGNNGFIILDVPNGSISNARDTDIQPDGKIVVTGVAIDNISGSYKGFVTRINTDGTVDNDFGENGYFIADMGAGHDFAVNLHVHTDDKIYVGGHSWIKNGPPALHYDFCMLRLNSNGTIDNTYGNDGVASIKYDDAGNYCRGFVLSASGKVYAVSNFEYDLENTYNISVFSFDENGMPNSAFGNNGIVNLDINDSQDHVENIALLKNGSIIIAGSTFPTYMHSNVVLANYFTDIETNVEHTNIQMPLQIYPNPSSEILKFDNKIQKGLYELKIYNSTGVLIKKQKLNLPGETLNIHELAKGNYILKLSSKKEFFTTEFIKQ